METALVRTKSCAECKSDAPCNSHGFGCLTKVPLHLISEFRKAYPLAELEAPPEHVVWEYWRAGYERSYHGEPGIVELGEIS